MKKPTTKIIKVYERNLKKYEDEGKVEKAEVQRRLLAKMKSLSR